MKNSKLMMNTAISVCFAVTSLFCGLTVARAQEPDNRIDWRWGRPGVMVVTNAPTAVTVTNIATDVAGGVANTMFGPRVTALEGALDGGTNNWNTAYGWGDHAGLYKAIGWFPSWTEVTDKPDLFDWNWNSLTNKPADFPPSAHTHPHTDITDPPWLTSFTETDEIALSRVTPLEGGTNNWNTAFGWGDHAGLYKAIGWVPSWAEVTDIPQDFPPSTHEHDYTAVTNPPWLTSFTEQDEIALSRVTVLEGKTNNWNTAFGWGDHAGLYRDIGWVPSWGNLTDIPQDFPPSTHEHDYTAVTNPPWLTEYTETDEIALSRVTPLEGGTNNWNTAYGWGNHAGLYRDIGWFPSWTEVTGKPDLFDWNYDSLTNVPSTFPPDA
ncbi:MAG: hypothetical protein PHQ41_07910, partial [Candidatus Cloacimonetes bacterium]|nr:hypothetical protein [Candidatus Cloacimonadota bacterium]